MTHEKTISDLAYHLWHARGCPQGSAEIDWAEAERQVRGRPAGVADRALDAPVPAIPPPAAGPKHAESPSPAEKPALAAKPAPVAKPAPAAKAAPGAKAAPRTASEAGSVAADGDATRTKKKAKR